MSPHEGCPGWTIPSLGWFRVWERKVYVLRPKADRRKDWEEKACTGHLIAYSTTKHKGGRYGSQSTIRRSQACMFCSEQPPDRPAEYYNKPTSRGCVHRMNVVFGQSRLWDGFGYGGARRTNVLKPKADRRKDWEEKAQTGHFIGYSPDKAGWIIWLPEYQKTVTSVHVLFDEQPPSRPDDYYIRKSMNRLFQKLAPILRPDL
jgi:hypothetical protein